MAPTVLWNLSAANSLGEQPLRGRTGQRTATAFYRLDFQVTNEGDETRYMDNYYGIYFNEDNGRYNDVLDWWGTEEEESRPRFLFEDYDYTYLPAGRIGTYQQVVQILDGVKSFTVDYYPGNVSDEKISFDMTIE